MKARLAQHTVDCSGDADTARETWRAQGIAWFAPSLSAEGWRLTPGEAGGPTWTWVCDRWGAQLSVLHLVEPGPHGTRIHVRAEVEGPLAWFHQLFLRARVRASLPEALRRVARGLAAPAS